MLCGKSTGTIKRWIGYIFDKFVKKRHTQCEKDNSLYEDASISNIDINIPKLQSFGVTLCNEKKTMSERQWSVYKKMLQLVTLIFPKLLSFGVTLCNEKKTMSERQWSVYKMLQSC